MSSLIAQSTPLEDMWPEPEPLGVSNDGINEYPLDALPPALRDAAEEVARFNKVPVASPAVVGLSVTATAIGKLVLIEERPGLCHRPTLFHALIAESGERKSPPFKHMTRPLELWEEEQRPEWERRCHEFTATNAISEKVVKGLENEAKKEITETARSNLIARIAEERGRIKKAPSSPRLYTTDATEQRLFQLMDDHDGKFAVLSGEGRPVIDSIMGRQSGEGYTGDAVYLAGVSGDSITRDRVGANSASPEDRKIGHPMLNVCIMVQPDKYMEAAQHPRLRASGALARIWPVHLPSLVGTRFEGENEPGLDMGKLKPFYSTVRSILSTEPQVDDHGKAKSHLIRLGPGAAAARREWHNIIERMMADGEGLEDVRDIAAKAVSATVKAAGILHILAHQEWLPSAESEIDLATWKSAQLLGEYHLAEAIRIQRMAGDGAQHQGALKTLRWLVKKDKRYFKRRDLMIHGPRPRPNVNEATEICNILCDHGYIRPRPLESHDRNLAYEVRPDVAIVANVAGLPA